MYILYNFATTKSVLLSGLELKIFATTEKNEFLGLVLMLSVRLFHMGIVEGKKEALWDNVLVEISYCLKFSCFPGFAI